MKKTINRNKSFYFSIILMFSITFYAKAEDSIAIIPKPLTVQLHSGHFVLSNTTALATSSQDTDIKETIQWFVGKIAESTGYHLSTNKSSTKNSISLSLNNKADTSLHDEGYTLTVTPSNITINANKA